MSHTDKFIKRHLKPNESVIVSAFGYVGKMMGSGDDTQRNGDLIVTNQRVVFYRKGWLGETFESIPINKITSAERRSTLGFKTLVSIRLITQLSLKRETMI